MTFLQDIAAIQAGMARRGATSDAAGAHVQPTIGSREDRRILDALATQFNTYIGPSVICLPMGDAPRDEAHGSGG
ncbi:MAG: hypothetical protein ABJA49_14440 [Betaproteobacteria bacterium]